MADDIITRDAVRLATDEIGGVHYPKSKIAFGENDTATDVTEDTPFPVIDQAVLDALAVIGATLQGAIYYPSVQPVSASALPLPSGAATAAKQDAIAAAIQAISSGTLTVALPQNAATASAQASLLTVIDQLKGLVGNAAASSDPRPVTPHASNPLPVVAKALFIGGGGNVVLRAENGTSDVTFANVTSGTTLLVRATHVRATSTATNIVQL